MSDPSESKDRIKKFTLHLVQVGFRARTIFASWCDDNDHACVKPKPIRDEAWWKQLATNSITCLHTNYNHLTSYVPQMKMIKYTFLLKIPYLQIYIFIYFLMYTVNGLCNSCEHLANICENTYLLTFQRTHYNNALSIIIVHIELQRFGTNVNIGVNVDMVLSRIVVI